MNTKAKFKIQNSKKQTKNIKIFTFLICVFYIWSFIFSFSISAQQAGTDIAVLNTGVGAVAAGEAGQTLSAFWAKNNQIACDKCQDQSDDNQINVSFHDSPFPRKNENEIHNNDDNAANNSGKKIGVCYVPFNHGFSSTSSIEIKKNTNAMNSDRPNRYKKSEIVGGIRRSGEITPAANQATAILPEISEALFNWARLYFFTGGIITRVDKECQYFPDAAKSRCSNEKEKY